MLFNINEMTSKSTIQLDNTCTLDPFLKASEQVLRNFVDTLSTTDKYIFMYFVKALTAYEEATKLFKLVVNRKKVTCNNKINDFYIGKSVYKENINNVSLSFTEALILLNEQKPDWSFTKIVNNSSENFYNMMTKSDEYLEEFYNGTN